MSAASRRNEAADRRRLRREDQGAGERDRRLAEGVVVGSAIVDAIAESLDADGKATPHTGPKVLALVGELASALREPGQAAAL